MEELRAGHLIRREIKWRPRNLKWRPEQGPSVAIRVLYRKRLLEKSKRAPDARACSRLAVWGGRPSSEKGYGFITCSPRRPPIILPRRATDYGRPTTTEFVPED